ncbi:hypothetical protein GJ496_006530, partial [Pomphorhynchus laevis]
SPDAYHTCYALSGLSILQHYEVDDTIYHADADKHDSEDEQKLVETHPYHNITIESYDKIKKYFM